MTKDPVGSAASDGTPAGTVLALYAALSVSEGEVPDSAEVRALFALGARIRFAGSGPGAAGPRDFTVDELIAFATPKGSVVSRRERERRGAVHQFGAIAQVFSEYELHLTDRNGAVVVRRGVNSVQLEAAGPEWRITSLVWDAEPPA